MLQSREVTQVNNVLKKRLKTESRTPIQKNNIISAWEGINVLQTTDAEAILQFFKDTLKSVIYKNSKGSLKNLGYHYSILEQMANSVEYYSDYLFGHPSITSSERVLLAQAFSMQGHLINLAYNLALLNFKYINRNKFNKLLSDSVEWQIHEFRKDNIPVSKVSEWINQRVEIVFLWHPTETNSSEFIECLNLFSDFVYSLQEQRITSTNKSLLHLKLTALLERLLFTSMAPTRKYDTEDSVDRMLKHFARIYFTLPNIYKPIQQSLWDNNYPIHKIPNFLQLTTWVGGDADGVPEMTSKIAEMVITKLKDRVVQLYITDLDQLIYQYESTTHLYKTEICKLKDIRTKLSNSVYISAEDLIEDLSHINLINCKGIENLILRVNTFRFYFAKLEFRQNSQVHLNVVNKIIPRDFIQSKIHVDSEFIDLKEKSKEKILTYLIDNEQLASTLLNDAILSGTLDKESMDLIDRIALIKRYPSVIENYAIAETNILSDILVIMFLFTACEFKSGVNFVPLFEKTETILNAPRTMKRLLSLESYKSHLEYRSKSSNNKPFQEIIIGYSDSGRRSGTIPNRKLLVDVQKEIKNICTVHGIQFRIHHANGDDINRGGGDLIEIIGHCPTPGHKKVAVQGKGWRIRYSHDKNIIEEILMFYVKNLKEFAEVDDKLRNRTEETTQFLETVHSKNTKQMIKRYKKHFFEHATLIPLVNDIFALKILKVANYTVRGISRELTATNAQSLSLDDKLTQTDWQINSIDKLRAIPWNHSSQSIGFNTSIVGLSALKEISQIPECREFRGKEVSMLLHNLYNHSSLFKEQMKTAAYIIATQNTSLLWRSAGLAIPEEKVKRKLASSFEMNKTKKLVAMLAWLDMELEGAKEHLSYSIYGSAEHCENLLENWPQLNSEVKNRNRIAYPLFSILTYLNKNINNINNNIELTRVVKAGIDELRLPSYSLRYPIMELIKN